MRKQANQYLKWAFIACPGLCKDRATRTQRSSLRLRLVITYCAMLFPTVVDAGAQAGVANEFLGMGKIGDITNGS